MRRLNISLFKEGLLMFIIAFTFSINNLFGQVNWCPTSPITNPGTCASQLNYQTKATGNNSFAAGYKTIASGETSTAFGYQTTASGLYSFAIGYNSVASAQTTTAIGYSASALGFKSVAIGENSLANSEQCYAFGQNAKANATTSMAIGRFVETNASGAIALGSSISGYSMINGISNSLMIGFNSTVPTVFVGRSPSYTSVGKVGIGTSDPLTNLHILSNPSENATLYVQTRSFTGSYYASLQLGNQSHGIIADPTNGLTFKTQRYYLFNDGDVGIGTSSPTAKLHVVGSTNLLGSLQVGQSLGKVNSIFYGKVGIGTASPQTDLQVNGSVSVGYESVLPSEAKSLIVSGYVGIGTFSPTVPLDVKGKIMATEFQLASGYMDGYILQSDENGNAHWVNPTTVNTGIWQQNGLNVTVDNTRKVGIGTATPAEPLHVAGNVLVTGDIKGAHNDWHSLNLYGNSSGDDGAFISIGNNSSGTASIKLFARGENGRVEFHNQNIQVMSIRADNNVYIGNPDVNSNLFVNGEITANLVRVNTQGWWDCVFEDNYRLMPLSELELFVKQNKRLPDIPSEADVKTNGMDVAEMNALLLKKVEELTMYVIELEKRVKEKHE